MSMNKGLEYYTIIILGIGARPTIVECDDIAGARLSYFEEVVD